MVYLLLHDGIGCPTLFLYFSILTCVQVGLAVLELLLCSLSFREATGKVYRAKNPISHSADGQSSTKEAVLNPITWICAIFLLGYVGIEVSLGGWLVTFMLKVRHGEPFASGLVATGFWLGITFGRIVLGFVTGKIGDKTAIAAYIVIAMGMELCFWLIPNFVASAIFAGWLGFFLGPMFPAAIVVATKLLPLRLHGEDILFFNILCLLLLLERVLLRFSGSAPSQSHVTTYVFPPRDARVR